MKFPVFRGARRYPSVARCAPAGNLASRVASETCYKSPVESKHAGGEHRRHAGCRA